MQLLGKVVGLMVGASLGGVFGAVLGAIAGHYLLDLPADKTKDTDFNERISAIKQTVKTHIKYDFSLNKKTSRPSWIGKISCTVLGFLVFGIWGAVIGFIIGHSIDIMRRQADFNAFYFENNEDPFTSAATSKDAVNTAFIQSMAALCAKLAKVDGQVSRSEVNAFKSLFSVPPAILHKVADTFNKAKETPAGFETYALQLKNMFGNSDKIYVEIIQALFTVAAADGKVKPEEVAYISQVSAIFGLSELVFADIASAYDLHKPQGAKSGFRRDDYEVLGVSRTAGKTEIRKAWLKLLRENHPDTLTAKGASVKEIKDANQRVAAINSAYDRICKGFK